MSFSYATATFVDVLTCPLCGTAQTPTDRVDRYGFPVGLVECACGLGYLSPRLSPASAQQFHEEAYRRLVAQCTRGTFQVGRLEALQVSHGTVLGQWWARWGLTSARLLDVGGSTGAVCEGIGTILPLARVVVTDVNRRELARATARGYQTIACSAEAVPVLDPPPTVVVCTQTLDHLGEPLEAFRAWRAGVAAGGHLWVDVVLPPTRIGPFTMDTQGHHVLKVDHPTMWTERALRRAVGETGWTVLKRRVWTDHLGFWCEAS